MTGQAQFGTGEAIPENLLTGEATGAHLTGAVGQGVSLNFVSILSAIKHNSSVLSKLEHGQKQPIKMQIFEIFECSGQKLLNSSCQF